MNGFLVVDFSSGRLLQHKELVPGFGFPRASREGAGDGQVFCPQDAYTVATLLYSSSLFLKEALPGVSITSLEFDSIQILLTDLATGASRLVCIFDARVPGDIASHLCTELREQCEKRSKVSLKRLSEASRFCFLQVSRVLEVDYI